MNTQKKIEVIRQACIKANPEIVELKFGCEIDDHEMAQSVIYLGQTSVGGDLCFIPSICDTLHSDLRTEDSTKAEVLGRPIRLADVFLLLKERYPIKDRKLGYRAYLDRILELYDLRADDLTQ